MGRANSKGRYPSIASSQGYHTIFAGMARFAPIGFAGEDPKNLGFDIYIAGVHSDNRELLWGGWIWKP